MFSAVYRSFWTAGTFPCSTIWVCCLITEVHCLFLCQAPYNCQVKSVSFICVPLAWSLCWHQWKLWSVRCPLMSSGLQVEFVLFVLKSESCFLSKEDDDLFVPPLQTPAWVSVSRHLMWPPKSASWWPSDANEADKHFIVDGAVPDLALGLSEMFCKADVVPEMTSFIRDVRSLMRGFSCEVKTALDAVQSLFWTCPAF